VIGFHVGHCGTFGLMWDWWKMCLKFVSALSPLLFFSCLEWFAGKTRIGERCWSRWRVIECEFGVAVWLVRWCSVVVFDWCVRLYFWVFLVGVFVFSPVLTFACVCVEFLGLFCFDYDGEFQVLVRE
jgi:hypothetical protein